MNFLVFEKEKFIRDMFEVISKRDNCEVYTAEAVENNSYLIDDLTPEFVLADYDTIKGDLDEFSECIKSSAHRPKVILMTASNDFDPVLDEIVDGVIEKPISPTGLIERIKASVK